MDIKKERSALGLTQQQLSEKTGIPRDRIAKWEQNIGKPKAKDENILLEFFGKKIPKSDEVKVIENGLEKIFHDVMQIKAMLRVALRVDAEILSKQRGESVTKVLGELTKAVSDEISVDFSEL